MDANLLELLKKFVPIVQKNKVLTMKEANEYLRSGELGDEYKTYTAERIFSSFEKVQSKFFDEFLEVKIFVAKHCKISNGPPLLISSEFALELVEKNKKSILKTAQSSNFPKGFYTFVEVEREKIKHGTVRSGDVMYDVYIPAKLCDFLLKKLQQR